MLICAITRQHHRDLGLVALKGWAEPVRGYQVLGMSRLERRFEATHSAKLPPLFESLGYFAGCKQAAAAQSLIAAGKFVCGADEG